VQAVGVVDKIVVDGIKHKCQPPLASFKLRSTKPSHRKPSPLIYPIFCLTGSPCALPRAGSCRVRILKPGRNCKRYRQVEPRVVALLPPC
jgi:hypothetical protein